MFVHVMMPIGSFRLDEVLGIDKTNSQNVSSNETKVRCHEDLSEHIVLY